MSEHESVEQNRESTDLSRVNVLTEAVIGAAIAVHRSLGPGFLESVYELALCVELTRRGIPFVRQSTFRIHYEGIEVGEGRVDLLVGDELVVELKAIESILPIHRQIVQSYLKALGLRIGLILNFRERTLKDGIVRVIQSIVPESSQGQHTLHRT